MVPTVFAECGSGHARNPGGPVRRHLRRRTPLWLAVLLVIGVGIAVLQAVRWAGDTLGSVQQSDPRRVVSADDATPAVGPPQLPNGLNQPFNVLLIGVDKRAVAEEGVRSDTLIVVHVDPLANWAAMLSIPRDSMVEVPTLGVQKINTAFGYGYANAGALYGEDTTPDAGGGALAAETVEGFLGVPIDYIVQVDFRGFERVVDTLGGITVDVRQPLLDPAYPTEDFGVERIYIPAGLQQMDGATALRYARSRHSTSDFDRSRRQQQVLRAILQEVRERGVLQQASLLPGLARDFEQSVATTLPINDLDTLRGLADLASRLDTERIMQLSITPNDVAVVAENGSDIYWEPSDVAALVERFLAGPP
ncbi:LCP family protein [Candidatus Gracilibacteria bacterium]|nr:LCP family protein [Candidatus Gracilibacteria bacterium]